MLPLPAEESFIESNRSVFRASRLDSASGDLDPESVRGDFDKAAARALLNRICRVRAENLLKKRKVCFFIGDAVNQFFSSEAADIVMVLNLLGMDVEVPPQQGCCSAPALYAGDAGRAARGAEKLVRMLAEYDFDWVVTSCSSGGLMLREEYPGLLGLAGDSYSGLAYDSGEEVFIRRGSGEKLSGAAVLYRENISGKVRDINELVADMLGFEAGDPDYQALFSGDRRPDEVPQINDIPADGRPTVVYHHPCHLNRGQGVKEQPEYILRILPGFRFVDMKGAEICCGGGGLFTFSEPGISARIGSDKARAIAEADPDIVATSCPLCRIQIADMLQRDYGNDMPLSRERMSRIPVVTPIQLMARDLRRMMKMVSEQELPK
jgi:glycolate oxidase iron-sulfur subunit